MQTVVISIITILSLICCESSIIASASKLSERAKPYAHWTHRARKFQSDRQKAEVAKKQTADAPLNEQLIKKIKKGDVVQVGKLLRQGADANAHCAKGISALMYAMFDKIHGVPLSSYELGREVLYGFEFRENPRIVELLLHHGAECVRSNPYLLKQASDEEEESLLMFIATRIRMHNFEKGSDLIMIATILGNLYRSAVHDIPTDALNKILYEVVGNAGCFTRVNDDQNESISNNALWYRAVEAAFFAGANPSQISCEGKRANDLILRLEELQNQQCNRVKDTLEEAGFPQELVALTLECMCPNPQCDEGSPSRKAMPHDLRALCVSHSLTDQDIHCIEHYLKLGGNVDVSVSLANLDKATTVSSVQQNTGVVFDLLDLAFKHDSPQLYDMLNQYKHTRIIKKTDCYRRVADFCAMYKMAEEKKCKQIMDFITVDRMHEAARAHDEQELKKLLEAGANVNARSHNDAWDLLRTVVFGYGIGDKIELCIRLLLAKGIDILLYEHDDSKDLRGSYQGWEGKTDNVLGKLISHYRGGADRIVALLLYVGVRPQYTNKYGRTIYDVLGPDYPEIKNMLQDPDHIERYVTPQDLAEFAAIKKEREESLAAMQAKNGAQTAAAPQS